MSEDKSQGMKVYVQIGIWDEGGKYTDSVGVLAATSPGSLEFLEEDALKNEGGMGAYSSRIFCVTLPLTEQQVADLIKAQIVSVEASDVTVLED